MAGRTEAAWVCSSTPVWKLEKDLYCVRFAKLATAPIHGSVDMSCKMRKLPTVYYLPSSAFSLTTRLSAGAGHWDLVKHCAFWRLEWAWDDSLCLHRCPQASRGELGTSACSEPPAVSSQHWDWTRFSSTLE